jgi:hypothetical protein
MLPAVPPVPKPVVPLVPVPVVPPWVTPPELGDDIPDVPPVDDPPIEDAPPVPADPPPPVPPVPPPAPPPPPAAKATLLETANAAASINVLSFMSLSFVYWTEDQAQR